MAFSIPLLGWSVNNLIPDTLIQVNFAQGFATSGSSRYSMLLMGNKTSSGTATADTVVYGRDSTDPLQTQDDANRLFGARSELARMFKSAVAIDPNISIYAIAVAESAGAAATGTITLTTNATGNGTLRVYVGKEYVDTAIASGDTITAIAANAVIQINKQLDWPVTATSALGVITLTAANKGPRGNRIPFFARILETGVGTTVSPSVVTRMSGGTTLDTWTTALATIYPKRFYYIVPAAEDATTLTAIVTQVNTQAFPVNGRRQRLVAGSIDTLANAITIQTALNAARGELVWLADANDVPSQLAANNAALYLTLEDTLIPRLNFSNFGQVEPDSTFWKISAPLNGAAPTPVQIDTALNNGITPIGVDTQGRTYLVKRITTSTNPGIRDAGKVTVSDRFGDDLKVKLSTQFAGALIGNDPKDQGQPPPGPNVLTPNRLKNAISLLVDTYFKRGLLQNVDEIKASIVTTREPTPPTRMTGRVALQVVDIADQIGIVVNQTPADLFT